MHRTNNPNQKIVKRKQSNKNETKHKKTTIQPHRITQNKQTKNREHSPVTQNQMTQIDESASVQTSYSGVESRLWEGLGGKVL